MTQHCLKSVIEFLQASSVIRILSASHWRQRAMTVSPPFVFQRLSTPEDVQAIVERVTANRYAVLLVHVSWAPMIKQQIRFSDFQRAYATRYPDGDLVFEYIDCTSVTEGYSPLRSLPGWKQLELQNNGLSLLHGYGELVWWANGRVVHVERPMSFSSADHLLEKTESLEMCTSGK